MRGDDSVVAKFRALVQAREKHPKTFHFRQNRRSPLPWGGAMLEALPRKRAAAPKLPTGLARGPTGEPPKLRRLR